MKKDYKTKEKGVYKMVIKNKDADVEPKEFDFDESELNDLAESYAETACSVFRSKLSNASMRMKSMAIDIHRYSRRQKAAINQFRPLAYQIRHLPNIKRI